MTPASAEMARDASSKASSEVAFTPELQRSQSLYGDSDNDDSLHPTPSDSTAPSHTGLYLGPGYKGANDDPAFVVDPDDDARNIHYIGMLFEAQTSEQPHTPSVSNGSEEASPSVPAPHALSRKRRVRDSPFQTDEDYVSAPSSARPSIGTAAVTKRRRESPATLASDSAHAFIANNRKLFADLAAASQQEVPLDALRSVAKSNVGHDGPLTSTSGDSVGPSRSAVPGDDLRAEVKKRMAEVVIGYDSLRAELIRMNVDMQFYENAYRTVDDRIRVLRDRIAKRSASLQEQRLTTRKVRDGHNRSKKGPQTTNDSTLLSRLDLGLGNDTMRDNERPVTILNSAADAHRPDRQFGMSDEELANVLGISTHDLTRFSTSLTLTSAPTADDESIAHPPQSERLQDGEQDHSFDAQTSAGEIDPTLNSFDVAAFFDLAETN